MNSNSRSDHPATPDGISPSSLRVLGPGPLPFRFDTHMAVVHDQIHGPGSHERCVAALAVIVADSVGLGVVPIAHVPYSTLNAPHLDATVADLSARGIHRIELHDLHPTAPLTPFHDPQQHMSAEWNDWVIKRTRHAAELHGVDLLVALGNSRQMEV